MQGKREKVLGVQATFGQLWGLEACEIYLKRESTVPEGIYLGMKKSKTKTLSNIGGECFTKRVHS